MTAQILDGRAYADTIRQELAAVAAARRAELGYPVTLAIVVLRDGDGHTASDVYIRQLRRTAKAIGMASRLVELPVATGTAGLLATLAALNADPRVHGILLQLPLPPHIDRAALLEAIVPAKDVDGITATNAGNLFLNLPALVPATVAAVIELLDRADIPLRGKRSVVVGASAVVGRPLALMLLQRDATVSVCHIYTRDLAAFTREAEVLVVAVGRPKLITAGMVRPGAVVVDVGINVMPDEQVVGDVDFAGVMAVAGALTPVPGGVGPLTNLMALRQTLVPAGDQVGDRAG